MDHDQMSIWHETIMLLYLTWGDLLSSSDGVPQLPDKRWLSAICGSDAYEVAQFLKDCDGLLLKTVYHPIYSYDDFKHHLAAHYPFAGALLAPAKKTIETWIREKSTSAFSSLHTMFSFCSRVSLPNLLDLQKEALCDYLRIDSSLPSSGFTTQEEGIISDWFPRASRFHFYENFAPHHGPGSVADCKISDNGSKYKMIGFDPRMRYLMNKCLDPKVPRVQDTTSRTARVIFVPKTLSKLRTICAEPATLQWAQQGFGSQIANYFSWHNYLRKRIDLSNAQLNADAAWEGSLDGSLATIDLSSASDSVSAELVRSWFRHSGLREILWCCRSNRASLPDGSYVFPKKYAPMGSNLCFPVECIIFAAMIEASILELGDDPRCSKYRVYGDDIIIETRYAAELMRRLDQNGFTVNTDKSFIDVGEVLNFRESCGGEFLNGVDVTPFRLSRKFSGYSDLKWHPSRIRALVDLCNDVNTSLPSIRKFLIRKLNCLPKTLRVPFDDSGLSGLFSTQPSNFHLSKPVYNVSYQTDEYKHGSLLVKQGPVLPEDEDIRLYEYLRLTNQRGRLVYPEDLVDVSLSSPGRGKWISKKTTFLSCTE